MTRAIISVLRPFCVAATIGVAAMFVACVWGWRWLTWSAFGSVFLSYLVVMAAGAAICFIDKTSRPDTP